MTEQDLNRDAQEIIERTKVLYERYLDLARVAQIPGSEEGSIGCEPDDRFVSTDPDSIRWYTDALVE